MTDIINILIVVWLSLCLLTLVAVVAYWRGRNRGWDHANELNDRYRTPPDHLPAKPGEPV